MGPELDFCERKFEAKLSRIEFRLRIFVGEADVLADGGIETRFGLLLALFL